jgi:hypothetical protein
MRVNRACSVESVKDVAATGGGVGPSPQAEADKARSATTKIFLSAEKTMRDAIGVVGTGAGAARIGVKL